MSEKCDHCGENDGRLRGEMLEDLGVVCGDCWDRMLDDGEVLPMDDGGYGSHEAVQAHPFRLDRYCYQPLDVLFASTPEDRTSAGTVRVLARGQSGKLGLKMLLDTIYVSWSKPFGVPEEWEDTSIFDLPGLYEGGGNQKTNDTVLRELLGHVQEVLAKGKWVVLVAVPRQLAYEVFVMARDPE